MQWPPDGLWARVRKNLAPRQLSEHEGANQNEQFAQPNIVLNGSRCKAQYIICAESIAFNCIWPESVRVRALRRWGFVPS